MHNFSVWLRIDSNPPDINRFQSHTGKRFIVSYIDKFHEKNKSFRENKIGISPVISINFTICGKLSIIRCDK